MKTINFIFIFLLLVSCGRNEIKLADMSLKELAKSERYIEYDVALFDEYARTKTKTGETVIAPQDLKLMRATTYRFYKHVKLVDGQYVLSANAFENMNMNRKIYDKYKANLDEMNTFARENKKTMTGNGMLDIDEEYLNSLLE